MKIATAMKTALAAFPQRERRDALAQFVTRYADVAAKLTHYRCVGFDADVITAFLDAAGFTDADYTLVKSELDPDTRQIRWKKESKCLNRLAESLAGIVREGVSRPEMYRCIKDGDPSRVFKDVPDPEDVPERAPGGEPHLSEIVQTMTDEILEWARPCSTPWKARVWGDCTSGTSYLPLPETAARETRVHIPQISALEQYAWGNNLLPDGVAKPPCLIFATGYQNMTAVRYMDDKDSVEFTKGIYDAPASLVLVPYTDSTGGMNPLKGFLADTAKQAFSNMQVKPDSKVAYVLTSGTVETEYAEEEFKLRIVEFVADPKKLWNYVAAIYESVYRGLVCTVMPHSHVGVNNNETQLFPDGARYITDMGGDDTGYNPFFTEDNHELLSVCAGVALARREDVARLPPSPGFCFRDALNDGYDVPIESLVRGPDEPEPEHIRIAPDKKDLPAMWFAATHLEPGAVTPARQTMIDAMAPLSGVSHREQAEGMQRFHDLAGRWDTANLSAIREDATPATEGPCLTAFVTGLAAAVVQSSPRDANEALAYWQPLDGSSKGHLDSSFVTNVYSGVVTDKSPTLAESVNEGATAFPSVYDARYEIDPDFARTPVGLAETAMFTKFVADMSAGTSPAQMTMAPKSEGTRRSFILIAETNFDYAWLRRNWLSHPSIRECALRAFNQAFMCRNHCFAASISPSYRVHSFPLFDRMSESFAATTGVSWTNAMTRADVICSDSDNVAIRPDSYGRTYFVYRVSALNAMNAMAAFRFLAGMPVHTKWLARLVDASRRSDETLTPEEVSSPTTDIVRKYIRLAIRKKLARSGMNPRRLVSHEMSAQDKLHVWLTAVSGPAADEGVGEMNAPSKALLTRAVVDPECDLPIISNFSAPLS